MADNGENLYPVADKKEEVTINKWNGLPYSKRYSELLAQREKLPVWKDKRNILQGLKDKQTLILAAKTGSGKTTQVPQFVLEAVYDIETTPLVDKLPDPRMMVACTSTSPMTAISTSHLVALQMDVTIGEEICFQCSSEDYVSANGVMKFLPDNVLLYEAMTDPLLKSYKVIIVDEDHERTCATDVLLSYLKNVLKRRSDLKLVVMSGIFSVTELIRLKKYFDNAALVTVDGGYSSVENLEIFYLEKQPDEEEGGYLEEAIKRVVQIHMDEDTGDILVFLAEVKEIEPVCQEIIKRVEKVKVVALNPLSPPVMLQIYESAPLAMKKSGPPGRKMVVTTNKAETSLAIDETVYNVDPDIEDNGFTGRRIVVTTNIAETSPAIDGIAYVVDCGYARQKAYCDQVHAEFMKVALISKESAEKRSHHAGRTPLGKCFRLYTKEMFSSLKPVTVPEFKESNLAYTILTLKKLGIDEPRNFDFMDPPDPERLKRALDVLKYLGALDDKWKLNEIGMDMADFPLEPQMTKMLVGSSRFHCADEILTISAMLSASDCFVHPTEEFKKAADEAKARFSCHVDGDHITLLNVYNAYKQSIDKHSWCCDNFVNARALEYADYLRHQLLCIMVRLKFTVSSTDDKNNDYYVNIKKAILAGFFMQVAYLNSSGEYFTVKDNQKVTLHLSSSQDHKPKWVVYNEFIRDEVRQTNNIRTVTPVCEEWLVELVPHYWKNVKKDEQEGE